MPIYSFLIQQSNYEGNAKSQVWKFSCKMQNYYGNSSINCYLYTSRYLGANYYNLQCCDIKHKVIGLYSTSLLPCYLNVPTHLRFCMHVKLTVHSLNVQTTTKVYEQLTQSRVQYFFCCHHNSHTHKIELPPVCPSIRARVGYLLSAGFLNDSVLE